MTRRPVFQFLRASFSLVSIAAWLLASNHCAVASFIPAPAGEGAAEHAHCPAPPQNNAPQEQERNDCDGTNCCKALSAPLALAKNPVHCDGFATLVQAHFVACCALPGEDHHAPIIELDTGPPERCSFAELVLQRSILAHAPPVVA